MQRSCCTLCRIGAGKNRSRKSFRALGSGLRDRKKVQQICCKVIMYRFCIGKTKICIGVYGREATSWLQKSAGASIPLYDVSNLTDHLHHVPVHQFSAFIEGYHDITALALRSGSSCFWRGKDRWLQQRPEEVTVTVELVFVRNMKYLDTDIAAKLFLRIQTFCQVFVRETDYYSSLHDLLSEKSFCCMRQCCPSLSLSHEKQGKRGEEWKHQQKQHV